MDNFRIPIGFLNSVGGPSMRSILPSVRQLEILVAVGKARNFSRAAETLGMSQSALSQAVAQTEFLLDVALVHRTKREATLTAAGKALAERAETLLRDLQAAVREAKAEADPAAGRVILACLSSIILRILPLIGPTFRKQLPSATLVARESDPGECVRQVKIETADVGIAMMMGNDPEIDFDPFIKDRFRFVCSHGHPLAGRKIIKWSELAKYDYVGVQPWSGVHQLVSGAVLSGDPVKRTVYEVSRVPTVLNIIEEANAVSAIPALALAHVEAAQRVFHCPIVDPVIPRTLGIITRRDRPLSPTAAAFCRILRATLRDHEIFTYPDVEFVDAR
jgi:DNA-binding transcriptional LysR family regulator